jgi:hypothetical protein
MEMKVKYKEEDFRDLASPGALLLDRLSSGTRPGYHEK